MKAMIGYLLIALVVVVFGFWLGNYLQSITYGIPPFLFSLDFLAPIAKGFGVVIAIAVILFGVIKTSGGGINVKR